MAGIRLEDEEFVDLYGDYTTLLEQGEKVSYIVAVLSDKYSVSERKVYGLGVKADKNKAKEFYEKACFGEDWLGCKNLAITYFKNQNFSKAAEIFAKGCELKDGFSCANLGYQYENGDGVAKDELKAIEFYKKGCIYEDGFACLNFGVSEANRNNFNEAQKLFKKACELGNKNACDYYKQITDDEFKKAHK